MKTNRKECELNKLCNFLLHYVAGSGGRRKVERTLKANKREYYFPNMMSLEHVTYIVPTLENHFDQWKHALWIETLKDNKKIKAKDYKRLEQGKWEKYAPKKPRYTFGAGTKREYGKSLVSDKGMQEAT